MPSIIIGVFAVEVGQLGPLGNDGLIYLMNRFLSYLF